MSHLTIVVRDQYGNTLVECNPETKSDAELYHAVSARLFEFGRGIVVTVALKEDDNAIG